MSAIAALAGNLQTSLVATAAVAGLAALAALLGRLLLARSPIVARSRVERGLLEVGLGLGLLTLLPFLLSIGRGLTPIHVRLALLTLAAAVALGLRYRSGRLPLSVEAPGDEDRPPVWANAALVAGAIFLAAVFVLCLTPMVDYDGLCYHAFAPKRWLQVGSLQMLPTLLNTEWPMGQEMLFTLLMPLAGGDACKPFVAVAALLAAAAVYALGSRLASRAAGQVAAALFLLAAGVPSINTTSVEVLLTLFTTLCALSLCALAQAEAPRERRGWLVLAALFAGFACCVKLTGLLALVFVVAATFVIRLRQDERPVGSLRSAVAVLAVALACASPWYVRSWLDTGNPVYPFAYSLFGGRDWSPQAARLLSTYFHLFGLPGDTVAARWAILMRQIAKFAAVIAVALALPSPRWARSLLLAAGLFTLAQVASTDQWRFLLPAAALGAVVGGHWVARLSARFTVVGWAAAALVVAALPGVVPDAVGALPLVVGGSSRMAAIRHEVLPVDACLWANRYLPPNARVLFGLDSRAYFLDRAVYWTSPIVQHRIAFDTQQSLTASLQREGITHLLINRNLYHNPEFRFEERVGWRAREREGLEALAARSRPLWHDANVTIYELPSLTSLRD
jgi:hypothetical protein